MNALLTRDEYAAMAAKVTAAEGAFIDGSFRPAISGKTFRTGTEKGAFVEPTSLDLADRDALPAREEIFGPILSVLTVDGFDEAIALANDTNYGLAASIFTGNVKKAIRGARAIRAGTLTVNSFGEGEISTPFGGYKQSGFGGRDNGIHAHDQYTQLKTIWVDLSDDADQAV